MTTKPEKTYKELLEEFEEVMAALQSETVDVEAATNLYARGLALTSQLETKLQDAENKVTKLSVNLDS